MPRHVVFLGVWLGAALAQASGIGSPLVGSSWSGVTSRDAAAIHHNPAMLASLEELTLQLDGALMWGDIAYQREYRAVYQYEDSFKFAMPLTPADVDSRKSGFADPVRANILLPTGAAFCAYRPAPRLTAGLGIYAPFGAALDPPDDGPQRFAVQEAFLSALFITPALSYRLADWLDLGGGVNLVIGMVNIRQVVDLAATSMLARALADAPLSQENDFGTNAPSGVRELEVLARPATLETTAMGASFNAGMTVRPGEDLTLALAYQHGVDLIYKGTASLDMDHDFFTQDLSFKGLAYPPVVEGTAYIEFPLPPAIRAGLGWQLGEQLELALQGSYVLWSVVQTLKVTLESDDLAQPELDLGPVVNLDLKRAYLDTIEVEALVGWRLADDWRLGARVGYHSPATPDATMDLSSIDGHRILAALMGDYGLTESFVVTASIGMQHLLSRRVVASRYDAGNGIYDLTIVYGSAGLSFAQP